MTTGFNSQPSTVSTTQATQAQLEAEDNIDAYGPPDLLHFGPSAAKGWASYDQTGTPAVVASYNVASIADDGTGNPRVLWATDFSTDEYSAHCMVNDQSGSVFSRVSISGTGKVAAEYEVKTTDTSNVNTDFDAVDFVAFGDQ